LTHLQSKRHKNSISLKNIIGSSATQAKLKIKKEEDVDEIGSQKLKM
jgi:hypothetical protein